MEREPSEDFGGRVEEEYNQNVVNMHEVLRLKNHYIKNIHFMNLESLHRGSINLCINPNALYVLQKPYNLIKIF